MKRWEHLEDIVMTHNLEDRRVSAHEIADLAGVPISYASSMLQSHQGAMRAADAADAKYLETGVRPKNAPDPLYISHRLADTRTRNALWTFGDRARHVRIDGARFSSDMRRRLELDLQPRFNRTAKRNKAALRSINAVSKVVEGAVELIAVLEDEEH